MKILVKSQHKIGTAQKQKNIKYKRMNKRMLELEDENKKLKKYAEAHPHTIEDIDTAYKNGWMDAEQAQERG